MSTIEQRIAVLKEVAEVAHRVGEQSDALHLCRLAEAVEVTAAILREIITAAQAPRVEPGEKR